MVTKVEKIESYKNSQGEYTVCRGKLKLIYNDKYLPEIGMIGSNNVHPLFMWTQQHKNNFKSLVEYHNTLMVQPIIISETEDIQITSYEKGDMYLLNGEIKTKKPGDGANYLKGKKILATSENFSQKQLRAIVDGKLKDGDDVLIECNKLGLAGRPIKDNLVLGYEYYNIKLTNNHIKIFPIKNPSFSEAEKEAIKRFERGEKYYTSTFIDEDSIIAGYGCLDIDFEYPLPVIYIQQIFRTTSWKEYLDRQKEIFSGYSESDVLKLLQKYREEMGIKGDCNEQDCVNWFNRNK